MTTSNLPGPSPLANLRVIELTTDPAGEMTGLQFVNAGADVLKIEPPGGAPSRHTGPFANDIPDPEKSLSYWYYNAGKRSAVLDLEEDVDRAALDSLLDGADVFLSSLHPIELGRLGIDPASIAKAHPTLIVVSVTPFGLTGPWAEYRSSDLVGMAASGLLITSGYDDHTIPPIRPGGDQAFHTAASFAHIGAMLALIERQQTGRGGLVDISMHEATGVTVELANPYWFYPRALVQRQTCRHAQPVPTQPALFECADGRYVYFALILADQKPWQTLVEWMDSQDLATDLTDEAYSGLVHRQQNFSHIQDVVECFFLLQDATAVYHEGQARGLPIGILNAPEDLYDDEHLCERGVFAAVEQPGHGTVLHPVSPYRFSTLAPVAPGPAPRLGEHNAEVGAPT